MPERPDLEYVVPILARELAGATVVGVRADSPVVLRVLLPERVDALLPGAQIRRVARRAHAVIFELGGPRALELVISPMLAGRFSITLPGETRIPTDLAFSLVLADGRELRYRDEVQMGKVYVLARGDLDKIPGLGRVGLDVLDPLVFTPEAFRAAARCRRDLAKDFLMDKAALDAMGNAYADEVLFEAKIHPKAAVKGLSDEEIDNLHAAIVRVLGDATRTIAQRSPALDEKLRDFLKVRGRPGHPCPRCGDKLRRASVHGHDAIFCPTCQPEDRKSASLNLRRPRREPG
ncbi:DNA-formamidopyrimidine glycosylase family protein [Sorangium cellulosum]|uniref:DNA-formamidopyrimidine glycosylase n=1 Tax=Sorangium cellulosum TaxID=56 RepID=A0A150QY68_SORCE|nr:DNA-formamidopyrimidine glycosylase family protein [Sorangium cellulosum]KYF72950.1 DNA-formamidopyrimidine glycosylase [Sorangium cellulosum]